MIDLGLLPLDELVARYGLEDAAVVLVTRPQTISQPAEPSA